MTEPLRVLVNGARGRMGRFTTGLIEEADDLRLVGATDLGDDLERSIRDSEAEVAVDFTLPEAALSCFLAIVEAGARPVSGTSGFTKEDVEQARRAVRAADTGGLIIPNFSIGAVLMMRFAEEAARHFAHVEIVETHHDRKVDAPSGTARRTAEIVAATRGEPPPPRVEEVEHVAGVRGGRVEGVPIHSLRLPGALAHQEVLFSGPGEMLTVKHDSLSRESFRAGILLAIRAAPGVSGLAVGLSEILRRP